MRLPKPIMFVCLLMIWGGPLVHATENEDWALLEGTIDLEANREAQDASLKVADGQVFIAWSEGGKIYVKRWHNNHWARLGEALNNTPSQFAYTPILVLDSQINPYVVWQEFDGKSRNLYVKHWTGSSWEQLGDSLDVNFANDIATPAIALDEQENPVVVWREQPSSICVIYAKRWTGQTWQALGNALNRFESENACRPSPGFSDAGQLFVSWYEWQGISNNIYVKAWLEGGWRQIGGPLDVTLDQGAYNPSLVVSPGGQPIVAWREYDGHRDVIFVKVWTGQSWEQLGDAVATTPDGFAQRPALAISKQGQLALAWEERKGNDYSVYASCWNGKTWTRLGGSLDIHHEASAHKPSLAFDQNGELYISWEERAGSSRDIYVKRYLGEIEPPANAF